MTETNIDSLGFSQDVSESGIRDKINVEDSKSDSIASSRICQILETVPELDYLGQ